MPPETTAPAPGTVIHKFERAGLGKAPFKLVANYESTYCAGPGCPVQPGSCCDYCGNGIMNVFEIRSADGKRSKIGCDCIAKLGDAGLTRVVNRKLCDARNKARHAREDAKIADIKTQLADPNVRAALASRPHPHHGLARQGATELDLATWRMSNAGRAGRVEVAQWIAAALKDYVAAK